MDKNVPFYIGIGNDAKYYRANDKKGRNRHWINIVNKHPYEVEILLDGLSWGEACKKEIEFISYYKRARDGGTLCNITLGGDGKLGVVPANAYKKGSIPYSKGKPMPPQVKRAIIIANSGKPSWNKGKSPNPESIKKQIQTKRERDVIYSGHRHFMYGKKQTKEWAEKSRLSRLGLTPWNKGKKWTEEELAKTKIKNVHDNRRIRIEQYSIGGILLASFASINEASRTTRVGKGCISLCTQGKRKTASGFVWKIEGA